MALRSATLRRGFLLLLAVAMLLPALAAGTADPCCSSAPGAGCPDDRPPLPGGGKDDPRNGDGHAEGHERALCTCGPCVLHCIVTEGASAIPPAFSGRLLPLSTPLPPSASVATPERPPSA